jgi:hypothetical protein
MLCITFRNWEGEIRRFWQHPCSHICSTSAKPLQIDEHKPELVRHIAHRESAKGNPFACYDQRASSSMARFAIAVFMSNARQSPMASK